VRPKECTAAILAQVDREMARISECDHHWEDGMEVSCFYISLSISTHRRVERICGISTSAVSQAQQHFKWFPSPETSRSSFPTLRDPVRATFLFQGWRSVDAVP
jgi:hypothetical protein